VCLGGYAKGRGGSGESKTEKQALCQFSVKNAVMGEM